jgi:hypothetical protein
LRLSKTLCPVKQAIYSLAITASASTMAPPSGVATTGPGRAARTRPLVAIQFICNVRAAYSRVLAIKSGARPINESVRAVPFVGHRRRMLRRYSQILIFTGLSGLPARCAKCILNPDRPDIMCSLEKGGAPALIRRTSRSNELDRVRTVDGNDPWRGLSLFQFAISRSAFICARHSALPRQS